MADEPDANDTHTVGVRPLILVRGFGGPDVTDEQVSPYQGFNDGTVYPGRRGDNYFYEGFVLRALKSEVYPYRDATNVVGFYADELPPPRDRGDLDEDLVTGTVVLDPATASHILKHGTAGTIWVYRYYDLRPRELQRYGEGMRRLIALIRRSAENHHEEFRGVDIVAHSMGGLVVREALLAMDREEPGAARTLVNRIVTLGTPHRGISFQRAPDWLLRVLPLVGKAGDEFASFDPSSTRIQQWAEVFDLDRVLTVVGTNYRTYGVGPATLANRLSSLLDSGNLVYNRSDGLVKQASAQLPGAPRTFVNKCHGGPDSLVTSREAYEIAMRFLHGSHRVSLFMDQALVKRGGDWFGRSEFYVGFAIKPRYVDFELFHQSPEAENCYGPFRKEDLSDDLPDLMEELNKPLADFGDKTTGWAGANRLIWEGWVDAEAKHPDAMGMVFRLDIYVGELDTFGIGFSDNVVFRKQYYVQVFPGTPPEIFLHTGEQYLGQDPAPTQDQVRALAQPDPEAAVRKAQPVPGREDAWTVTISGTGFEARLHIAIAGANSPR